MKMPGERKRKRGSRRSAEVSAQTPQSTETRTLTNPDRALVLARRTLLDVLDALRPHLDALILVGAQAIYFHTGDADLAVAPFTSDADLALNPDQLQQEPALEAALQQAGFTRDANPGTWISSTDKVAVDLMVPEALSPQGRRGARLPSPHGNRAARKARGLEAALVDCAQQRIASLDPADTRAVEVAIAGPAALLIAKLHKLADRRQDLGRLEAKDALDIYRILKVIPTAQLHATFIALRKAPVSHDVSEQAIVLLRDMFGDEDAQGVKLAVDAAGILEDPEELSLACVTLARRLLDRLHD